MTRSVNTLCVLGRLPVLLLVTASWSAHGLVAPIPSKTKITRPRGGVEFAATGKGGDDHNEEMGDIEAIPALTSRRAFFASSLAVAATLVTTNAGQARTNVATEDRMEATRLWTRSPTMMEAGGNGAGSSPEELELARMYPDEFVDSLTRFLIRNDKSLRSWWTEQAALVPATASSGAIFRQRSDQLDRLASTVRVGLAGRFSGKSGPDVLLDDLVRSYGRKPSATKRLCAIFAMLDEDVQPTQRIANLLAGLEELEQLENTDQPLDFSLVFPEDRRLVEFPSILSLRRTREDGPFEAYTGGFDFSFGQRFGMVRPSIVSREKPLGFQTYARFFAAGALASGFAHAALTPVDMLKTRLQTQPDKYGDGPIKAAATILNEEGAGAFIRGLGPTAAGYFLAGAIAFGGTEYLKRISVAVLGPSVMLAHPFLVVLLCGAVAVAACDLVAAPFEAARIRLVDDPDFAPSLPQALARIAKEEGGGLYAGLPALLVKDVPFHATKFAVFDTVSSALRSSAPIADMLPAAIAPVVLTSVSGVLAGIAAAVVSQPADATFTRCTVQADGTGKTHLSPVEAFADLLKTGGIGTGLLSRCFFGGCLVTLQFAGYDAARTAFHITTGDLTLFLDAFSGLSAGGVVST